MGNGGLDRGGDRDGARDDGPQRPDLDDASSAVHDLRRDVNAARCALLLCIVPACGRISFSVRPDAPVPLCDVAAPFTSVQPVAELNTTFLDGGGRFTSNELAAVFDRGRLAGTGTRVF